MKPLTAWGGIVLIPVVVIGGLILLSRDTAQRNDELITQMATSPAYRTGDPNPVLRAGMTMQPPVVGTVPRGSLPPPVSVVLRDTGGVAFVDTLNPMKPTKGSMLRAKHLFDNYCAVCHGYGGAGDGPMVPKYPNPPSYMTPKSRALSDATLYKVITEGRLGMPSHAPLVSHDDRWRLVLYIRSLQGMVK